MKRTRTIHSDRNTSYRIEFATRKHDEPLEICIQSEDGTILFHTVVAPERLTGITSLHFYYKHGRIEWDSVSEPVINK